MDEQQIAEILERYKAGEATEEEKALLLSWSLNFRATEEVENLSMEDRVMDVDMIWTRLNIKPVLQIKKRTLWPKLLAAAVLLAVLSFGTFFYVNRAGFKTNQKTIAEILPGTNSATLTLSNGKKVLLDDAGKQQLLSEAGISITKTKDGQLIYNATQGVGNGNVVQYNTLETYKGQQYQVILPDGSHVWLNAASSLRYPVVFNKKERLVELSGEGYFEVAHNNAKPFRVKTAGQLVEVLGTHFNVNAYPEDEVSKTTLLEGSVRVTVPELDRLNKGNVTLTSGHESILIGNQLQVQEADLDAAVAWRDGDFMFEGENIRSIMKKISRWYDVEIVYEGEMPDNRFGGTVSRFENVSQVLRKLEYTGKVHFRVEGRRIIVTK